VTAFKLFIIGLVFAIFGVWPVTAIAWTLMLVAILTGE